jgi:hypothetical protein
MIGRGVELLTSRTNDRPLLKRGKVYTRQTMNAAYRVNQIDPLDSLAPGATEDDVRRALGLPVNGQARIIGTAVVTERTDAVPSSNIGEMQRRAATAAANRWKE